MKHLLALTLATFTAIASGAVFDVDRRGNPATSSKATSTKVTTSTARTSSKAISSTKGVTSSTKVTSTPKTSTKVTSTPKTTSKVTSTPKTTSKVTSTPKTTSKVTSQSKTSTSSPSPSSSPVISLPSISIPTIPVSSPSPPPVLCTPQDPIVVNGYFADGTYDGFTVTPASNDNTMVYLVLDAGATDHDDPYAFATNGIGTIAGTQAICLTPGKTYNYKFDLGLNPNGVGASECRFSVLLGGVPLADAVQICGPTYSPGENSGTCDLVGPTLTAYQVYTGTYTATMDLTEFTFNVVCENRNGPAQLLDNIVITPA